MNRTTRTTTNIALLTTLLAVSASGAFLDNAEYDSCFWEDQSPGIGGQAGGCAFVCPPDRGTFGGEINANDADAEVQLVVSCGGFAEACGGDQSCSVSGSYVGGGDGECAGETHEYIDSGVSLSCWAEGELDPEPEPDCIETPAADVCLKEFCQRVGPVEVCVDKIVASFADSVAFSRATPFMTTALLERTCEAVSCIAHNGEIYLVGTPGQTEAHIIMDGASTIGLTCDIDAKCAWATVQESFVDGKLRFSL